MTTRDPKADRMIIELLREIRTSVAEISDYLLHGIILVKGKPPKRTKGKK